MEQRAELSIRFNEHLEYPYEVVDQALTDFGCEIGAGIVVGRFKAEWQAEDFIAQHQPPADAG